MNNLLITKDELSKMLKCELKTIKWLVTSRQIPFLRIGREIRFTERDVSDWINNRVVKTPKLYINPRKR
jgi:excisionase family DNA binding protein